MIDEKDFEWRLGRQIPLLEQTKYEGLEPEVFLMQTKYATGRAQVEVLNEQEKCS